MSAQDRARWDTIFKQNAHKPFPAPDPLLLAYTPLALQKEDVRALDLCAGLGQNGLWLAEQGYATDIMDISRVALTRGRREMTIRNLRNVNMLQVDVDQLVLEHRVYDVVCVFRYLRRTLFQTLKNSIRSGGRIIYESYNMRYLTQVPDFNRGFLFEPNELKAIFSEWQVLLYEELDDTSRIVALKP